MKVTKKQKDLLKELTNKLESLCDKGEVSETSSSEEEEIEELSSMIETFETLHFPITEVEKKYSKIIKELFSL